jgi:hypothetical protein
MSQNFDLERDLRPEEIAERTELRDQLDDERDALVASIEDRRREIRGFNAKKKKLEAQLRDVRRELKTGRVFESPQTALGLELAPTDPFEVRYPMPRDHERLHAELAVVLQGVLVPSIEKLERWPADSGIFHAVGHWTRTELAYMNAKQHPDIRLPTRDPMPEPLAELRMYLGKASKPRPRAVKVRPAGGTPVRTGQGRRAKGADQVRDSSVKRKRVRA